MTVNMTHLKLKPSVCIDAVFEGLPVDEAIQQVQAAGIAHSNSGAGGIAIWL